MAWLACVPLAAAACVRTVSLDPVDAAPHEDDGGARDASLPDGGTMRPDVGPIEAKCDIVSAVDLLLVIDNSNSMAEEQDSLAAAFPDLLDELVHPSDHDGDGQPDHLAVVDLHVGVVTTDMGTGDVAVPTCGSGGGDDGILLTRGNTSRTGCAAAYPPWLSFDPRLDDAATFEQQFTCVADTGTGGCGFEQPLEAALKALTPSTSPVRFITGHGHADVENAGFLRPDSLIVVLVVTDEEDCSAADPEIYDVSSTRFPGDQLNLRCFQYEDPSAGAVQPVSRYVDGLRALRAGRPDLVVFAAIAGVPPDLVTDPEHPDYDAILAAPEMQETIDPMDPIRLLPSCNVPGRGIAFPPRRIVSVARDLAPGSVVQSICQADFRPAAQAIARLTGRRACLQRMTMP